MSVIRVRHDHGKYFTMGKAPIEDKTLSWKAKGILAYLMSKADGWEIQHEDLMKKSTDGDHAVRTALHELERAGYLVRSCYRDEQGQFQWIREVYEIPVPPEKRSDPDERKHKPHVENPQMESPQLKSYINKDVSMSTDETLRKVSSQAQAPALPGFGIDEKEFVNPETPDWCVDLFESPVKDLLKRDYTLEQWGILYQLESSAPAPRETLLARIRSKINRQHPAILAYRTETHYYPPGEWSQRIMDAVGTDGKVDFWKQVVAAWVGLGWNPQNVKGMLGYFERGELPGNKPNGKRPPGEGVIKTLDDGSRVRVLRDEEHDITMTIPYVEGPRIVYHNRGGGS